MTPIEARQRGLDVIESCETLIQLGTATRYIALLNRRFDLPTWVHFEFVDRFQERKDKLSGYRSMIHIMLQTSQGYADLGPILLPPNRIPSLSHYFCPQCGTEWAFMLDTEEQIRRHQAHHATCIHCGGGSLNLWGDYPLLSLSKPALLRELNLIKLYGAEYAYCNFSDDPRARKGRAERIFHDARRCDGDWQNLLYPDFS